MAKDATVEMTETCLMMRTRLISRVITGIYDDGLRPFGVNSPQFALLIVVNKIGPANRAEIGRFNRQDRSTLTRNLQIMIDAGWLEEIENEAGGRGRPIALTKSGVSLLHEVAAAWRQAQTQAKAVLGKEGVQAVMNVAGELINA